MQTDSAFVLPPISCFTALPLYHPPKKLDGNSCGWIKNNCPFLISSYVKSYSLYSSDKRHFIRNFLWYLILAYKIQGSYMLRTICRSSCLHGVILKIPQRAPCSQISLLTISDASSYYIICNFFILQLGVWFKIQIALIKIIHWVY